MTREAIDLTNQDSSMDLTMAGENRLVSAAWAQFERISAGAKSAASTSHQHFAVPGYRILGEIHRGGQGVVYQAIQESTQRKIAIKVLKEGPFADQTEFARFEREIDVLSRLNHPHVVAIHDRGLSAGHAYYVMDYIAGKPLDAHVTSADMSVREVLSLFIKVCEAVNVAHLRGVIHRDLKPGNIRVDVEGEPRILDFGLAKLAQEAAGGSSAQGMTITGQFIGSLPWASPEQAEGRSELLDLRTDVYSLGIILYQLLTGRFPYPVTGRIDDVVRHITQTSPARPSTTARRIDHDLELILLKCLTKEPERRYQSAGELARDVRHYLADEPVSATSPSAGYRLRKFVKRNRGPVFAGLVVATTLLIATAVSISFALSESLQRKEADAARRRAETAESEATARASELEKVAMFQEAQLSGINAATMGGDLRNDLLAGAREAAERSQLSQEDLNARMAQLESLIAGTDFTGMALEALDQNFFQPALAAIHEQFADQPLVKARLLQSIATTLRELGMLDNAVPPQDEALAVRRSALGADDPDTLTSVNNAGYLLWKKGKLPEAEALCREAVEGRRRVLGNDNSDTLDSIDKLSILLREQGKYAEAEPYVREALEGRRRVLGDMNTATIASVASMANQLKAQGKLAEAEPYDREALEKYRTGLGDDHPYTIVTINNLAHLLQLQGKLAEAEPLQREALERARRILGDDHHDTLTYLSNLAMLLKYLGRLEEAEVIAREAVEKRRRTLGPDHAHTLMSVSNLASILSDRGQLVEAEALSRETLEKRRRILGEEHPDTLVSLGSLGTVLLAQRKLDEAEELSRQALTIRKRVLGDEHPLTANALNNLGAILKQQGRLAESEEFTRQALDIRRRVLGNEHRETLVSILNFSLLLKDQNKLDDAELYGREAMDTCRRVLGEEHLLTVMAIGSVGALLEVKGRPAEAIELLDSAESAARRLFTGGNTLRLARWLVAQGHARRANAEFAAAEAKLTEAESILQTAVGATPKDHLDLANSLIDLYDAWHAAEPGNGHDTKSNEWRMKKAELEASTQPAVNH